MAIDTTSTATNTLDKIKQTSNPSKADGAKQSLAGDFDNFLLMLTTQLQNQDPTQPMDANQFTQQLVAFTGVEQAIATNKNLEKLVDFNKQSQVNNAVSFIGKGIEADGNQSLMTNHVAEFTYELPPSVAYATVNITDETGRLVFTGDGPTKAGKNTVYWNGVNSFTSADEKDGIYKITVLAKDSAKKEMEGVKHYSTGKVTGVEMGEDGIELLMGTVRVPIDKVKSIKELTTVQTPGNGNSQSSTSGTNNSNSSGNNSSSNSNNSNSNS